jgi:pimeloyl-ACP methyl ester carboxylesterase
VSPVERSFEVRGRRIAARCWHDPALPPVLALHGWQDNAATFDRLAPLLPEFHIVAMDFAGHGLSDWRPAGTRYHTVDHVDDVLGVVEALGWETFTLLGHSMGAGIGVLLAGALPERVTRLMLIDGLGPYPGDAEQAPEILREALLEWQDFAPREERVFASLDAAVTARRRGFTPLGEDAARLLCTRGVKAVPGGFAWTLDRRVRHASPLRFTETQARAFLQRITAPVMMVRAEPGFPGAAELFAARWQAVRHGTLHSLPGSHHLHLEEQADAVATLFRGFAAS